MVEVEDRAIGLDFGNNYTRIGVWVGNHIEIVSNELGNRTTPSCVAFTEAGRLIGNEAKNKIATNPHNTIYNVRRLIGRQFNDQEIQLNIKNLPFIVFDRYGKPYIQVEYKFETKIFAPEEIISMILTKMKKIAEAFLGGKVSKLVITIGGPLNIPQLRAIKDAALISGLSTLRVIRSTSSAAYAFTLEKSLSGMNNILIFDLGGSTTDVSLVTIENNFIEVKAVASDTHLGGEDFDSRLVNYYIQVFEHKYKKDISKNGRALSRLRTACERAKRELSISSQTSIEIDSFFENIDFYTFVTRSKFEELNEDLFHLAIELIKKVLKDIEMDKSEVDEIILVGGSSRIPRIQKLISDFFQGKELNKSINPDEAMAYGAAVQAAILNGDTSKKLENIFLRDVFPVTIGIETDGGMIFPLVRRNTFVPTKKTAKLPIISTNMSNVVINVYEGESLYVKDNYFLGTFMLNNILPTRDGSSSIEVIADIDSNNVVTITVRDCTSGRQIQTAITSNEGGLSKDELARMTVDSERYFADDERLTQRIEAHNKLESYLYKIRNILQDKGFSSKINPNDKKKFDGMIQESIIWLDDNQEAGKYEYDYKLELLEKKFYPLIRLYEK